MSYGNSKPGFLMNCETQFAHFHHPSKYHAIPVGLKVLQLYGENVGLFGKLEYVITVMKFESFPIRKFDFHLNYNFISVLSLLVRFNIAPHRKSRPN